MWWNLNKDAELRIKMKAVEGKIQKKIHGGPEATLNSRIELFIFRFLSHVSRKLFYTMTSTVGEKNGKYKDNLLWLAAYLTHWKRLRLISKMEPSKNEFVILKNKMKKLKETN